MDRLSELSKFKFCPHPPAPAGNDVLLPGTAAVPFLSFTAFLFSPYHSFYLPLFKGQAPGCIHLGCLHGALYTTRDLADAQGMSMSERTGKLSEGLVGSPHTTRHEGERRSRQDPTHTPTKRPWVFSRTATQASTG